MSGLGHVQSFRDLVVYRKMREAAKRVFEQTKTFPKEEKYSLTDQVRRSSRSVGGQIAEAWAKRRYENHFVSKLTDADAELQETQHWILAALDAGYLSAEEAQSLDNELAEVGRMLNAMMEKSALFCGAPAWQLRDAAADYFAP